MNEEGIISLREFLASNPTWGSFFKDIADSLTDNTYVVFISNKEDTDELGKNNNLIDGRPCIV